MKFYYVGYSVMGWLNGKYYPFATEEEYKEAYADAQASNSLSEERMINNGKQSIRQRSDYYGTSAAAS